MDDMPGAWDVVKWLGAGMVGVLAWVGKGHDDRIRKLEENRMSKADADQQRQALKESIDFLRQDLNTTTSRIFERLDDLADRLPRKESR